MNDDEFHRLMQEVDPDRSGEIDYGEFIGFFLKKANDPTLWGSGSGVSWQVRRDSAPVCVACDRVVTWLVGCSMSVWYLGNEAGSGQAGLYVGVDWRGLQGRQSPSSCACSYTPLISVYAHSV